MILNNKSKTSHESAVLLHDREIYHSSVHCAYYSCVQKAKHILIHELGKNYDHKKDGSFHTFYIKALFHDLKEVKSELFKAVDFQDYIIKLKLTRENSDYEEIEISPDDCDAALDLTEKIHSILEKHYKLDE